MRPSFHGVPAVPFLSHRQQLAATPLSPNLDLGGVLDQLAVFGLPRVAAMAWGARQSVPPRIKEMQ
jgi:hypothetical protein